MSGKYALIIANTEYTDSGLAQLTAPDNDAEDLARVLSAPEIAAFDKATTFINENVSTLNEAIEGFFSERKLDDLLVFYFSGHGVRDESGSLYLAVKNTNRTRLRSTAIRADFVREMMDNSRSRRQTIILDCCNSGAFAQGTKAEFGGSMGFAPAFEGKGYGRVVLTATDSTQFAWEGDKIIGNKTKNSLFTHYLVKGLEGEADKNRDGNINVDELYDYAYEQIVKITPNQTPGKWSYKQQGEILLREGLPVIQANGKTAASKINSAEEMIASLQRQIQSLEAEIEKLEERKNISEIKNSDYFQDLTSKAKDTKRAANYEDKTPQDSFEIMDSKEEDLEIRKIALEKEIQNLLMEIAEQKNEAQVSEIVGPEFFKDLAEHAQKMRQRIGKSKDQN